MPCKICAWISLLQVAKNHSVIELHQPITLDEHTDEIILKCTIIISLEYFTYTDGLVGASLGSEHLRNFTWRTLGAASKAKEAQMTHKPRAQNES